MDLCFVWLGVLGDEYVFGKWCFLDLCNYCGFVVRLIKFEVLGVRFYY